MASPGDYGLFVNTTQVWDVSSQLQGMNVNSPEFKELLVRMYMDINRIALALNQKETGYYVTMPKEFVDGNTWFPNPANNSQTAISPTMRNEFRTVINFGALPNTATKSVTHGIPVNSGYTFTRIFATASDTTGLNYLPIPYVSQTALASIELYVDATSVYIITAQNYTSYDTCYVVLEYLKN